MADAMDEEGANTAAAWRESDEGVAAPVGQGRSGFQIADASQLERTGNWSLVRRSLDCRSFGINLVEIPLGGSIPEHDELERDQEEVFFVVSGAPVLVIDGEEHALGPGAFARIDPVHRRTVRNRGDELASVLIISAPCGSGYQPMDWA